MYIIYKYIIQYIYTRASSGDTALSGCERVDFMTLSGGEQGTGMTSLWTHHVMCHVKWTGQWMMVTCILLVVYYCSQTASFHTDHIILCSIVLFWSTEWSQSLRISDHVSTQGGLISTEHVLDYSSGESICTTRQQNVNVHTPIQTSL